MSPLQANLSGTIAKQSEDGLKSLKILSDALEGKKLEVLDLSRNALGLAEVEACSGAFGPDLQALTIKDGRLSEEAMVKVKVRALSWRGGGAISRLTTETNQIVEGRDLSGIGCACGGLCLGGLLLALLYSSIPVSGRAD